jgi:pimeloyl-ACP methyl ester carboxylesterase
VIAGGPSSPVPQEHVAELVRILTDGRLVTVDAGHLVHAARPDEFTHHLLTFLDA